jgi:hypothetical protein
MENEDEFQNTLNRYCVTCHNETLKTANLMLDKINLTKVSENPQIWERVITKLSLRQMPPVGMPRPDDAFYKSFVDYLGNELDSVALTELNTLMPYATCWALKSMGQLCFPRTTPVALIIWGIFSPYQMY